MAVKVAVLKIKTHSLRIRVTPNSFFRTPWREEFVSTQPFSAHGVSAGDDNNEKRN